MRRNFGFAAILALAALSMAACDGTYTLTPQEQQTADYGLLQYVQTIPGAVAGTCSGQDSNSDGYVTCGYTPRDATEPKELVCSYQGSAAGCKRKD